MNQNFYIKNKQDKLTIPFLLCVLFVLQSISPWVARFISDTVTTYSMLGVVIVLFIVILFRSNAYSSVYNKVILCFIPILILNFILNTIHPQQSIFYWGYSWMLTIILPIISVYILLEKNNYTGKLAKIYFGAFAVTAATTILGLYRNPLASRFLATVSNASNEYNISLERQNIGGFSFIYMVVLLYPMFICAYKNKKLKLWQMGLITGFILWLLIRAEYATAFILFLATSFLLFYKKKLTSKNVIIIFLAIALLLTVLSSPISTLFRYLAENIESQTLTLRFEYIADSLSGITTTSDAGLRRNVLETSLNAFLENPVLGTGFTGNYSIGGHSYILDILASLGIIGGIAIFIMYRTIYVIFYKPLKQKPFFGFMVWGFCQTIVLSIVNTENWLFVLALGIPMIARLISPVDEQKKLL